MRHSAGAWSGKTSEVPIFRKMPQPENASRFEASEWDAVSPRGPIGKSGTGIRLSSGMQFPQQARLENRGPESPLQQSVD